MFAHRHERNRVDVVDLDPYGTAGPFIDSAVQCVEDGGKCVDGYQEDICTCSRITMCDLHRFSRPGNYKLSREMAS